MITAPSRHRRHCGVSTGPKGPSRPSNPRIHESTPKSGKAEIQLSSLFEKNYLCHTFHGIELQPFDVVVLKQTLSNKHFSGKYFPSFATRYAVLA